MAKKSAEQEAAERGARWLDKHEPKWAEGINLSLLDLEDETQCVLGQCYGDYYDALNELRPQDEELDQSWARAHGFNCQLTAAGNDKGGSYERLALAWAPLIAYRQMKARIDS